MTNVKFQLIIRTNKKCVIIMRTFLVQVYPLILTIKAF